MFLHSWGSSVSHLLTNYMDTAGGTTANICLIRWTQSLLAEQPTDQPTNRLNSIAGHSVVIISRRTPRSSRRHPFIILFMNLLASDSFIGQINNKMPNSRKRAHSSLWSNRRMFGYRIETACLVISCFINWQFHFLHVNLCESHRQDK